MDIVSRGEINGVSESPQLVERMDSAIGEASTSIGMIMSELVRRSLRGGVGEIGTSIHEYARDQVGVAIELAMPTITETVEQLAEKTSVRMTDVALNRFGEELRSVETRTSENTQIMAARIKAESQAAIEVVNRVIDESRETNETTAKDLRELQLRAKESWKKMQLELKTMNDGRLVLEQQLQATQEQLSASQNRLAEVHRGLDEASQRQLQSQQQLEATSQQLEATRVQLAETRRALAHSQKELLQTRQEVVDGRSEIGELRSHSSQKTSTLESICVRLEQRLEELERPRGFRALFSKMTGGSKKTAEKLTDSQSEEEA